MADYHVLSDEMQKRITDDRANCRVSPYAFRNEDVIRRNPDHDKANLWRPAFVRDTEKILHIPFYSRYMDKTQVFSFIRNDDISRRALHVQLVSRIARNIGSMLGLNCDLIEAIALGHDIGHTPFGHPGEAKLSELYYGQTGRFFNHNIHSARVLDKIFPLNMSLQTLDGIICHNGELECRRYEPAPYSDFALFDAKMESCYVDTKANAKLVPATLEGCVVRVSDIIAYLGKDRQDAARLGIITDEEFSAGAIGSTNAEIINNMIVNIIENSYGEPFLKMDDEYFEALSAAKSENYSMIYKKDEITEVYDRTVGPMFELLYDELLRQAKEGRSDSLLYRHHVNYILESTKYYANRYDYRETEPNQLVVDYLAGMTDDYFVDLFENLFPKSSLKVTYKGYFE